MPPPNRLRSHFGSGETILLHYYPAHTSDSDNLHNIADYHAKQALVNPRLTPVDIPLEFQRVKFLLSSTRGLCLPPSSPHALPIDIDWKLRPTLSPTLTRCFLYAAGGSFNELKTCPHCDTDHNTLHHPLWKCQGRLMTNRRRSHFGTDTTEFSIVEKVNTLDFAIPRFISTLRYCFSNPFSQRIKRDLHREETLGKLGKDGRWNEFLMGARIEDRDLGFSEERDNECGLWASGGASAGPPIDGDWTAANWVEEAGILD